MKNNQLKNILEALLMSSTTPLNLNKLQQAFSENDRPMFEELKQALNELKEDYEPRAVQLNEIASGFTFQTKPEFSPWIERLAIEKPSKYSKALLETLAIIAYKQPVTRGDIESIRGVAVSSHIIKTLLEREWIKSAGYRDVPGKPSVYVTTRNFLDYFNLKSLSELPELPNIEEAIDNTKSTSTKECEPA